MKSLELKYDDYIENAIFSKKVDKDTENHLKKLYDKLDEYNKLVNNGKTDEVVSVGYSPLFGYYTYSRIDENNYQLMKLGKDLETAFLKIVINNIEFRKAVDAENRNKEKYVDTFEKAFEDMEYSSTIFYAEYMLNKFKKYYKDNIPEYVISYFEDYVYKTTGMKWKYNGFAFYPIKEDVKMKVKELDN